MHRRRTMRGEKREIRRGGDADPRSEIQRGKLIDESVRAVCWMFSAFLHSAPLEGYDAFTGGFEPGGEAFRALEKTGAFGIERAGRAKEQGRTTAKRLGRGHARGDAAFASRRSHLPNTRGQAAIDNRQRTIVQFRLAPQHALEREVGKINDGEHLRGAPRGSG